jgi:hypothetical protein
MALLGARKEAILEAKDAEGNIIEEHKALFTIRALADAEVRLGKSVGLAVNGFATGKSGIRELAILLMVGLEAERKATKAEGSPVSFDDACEVLEMVGITPVANAIGPAVTAVLNYGDEEKEPAEKNA